MPYTTAADVRAVWDGDSTDQQIEALIARAEVILGARVRDLADRIAAGSTSAAMVAIVVSNVVARFLNNPRGYTGEHAGEVGYYYAQSGKNTPAGQIAFTDSDLAELGIVGGLPRSVRMSVPRQREWPLRECS